MAGTGTLDGLVALVTGAASGLGAATARLLAQRGARVYLCDVRDEQGRATATGMARDGLLASYRHLDVTDEQQWVKLVDDLTGEAGGLDILVNNAGLSGTTSAGGLDTAYWHQLLAVNLTGAFFGMKAAWPALRRSAHPSIVNVCSVAAVVGIPGVHAGYSASKGGLRILSKSMALEMGADRIRVNTVEPGMMPPMNASTSVEAAARAEVARSVIPLGREAAHVEVAEAIAFLAAPAAAYITGAELYADGGWLAH